MMDWKRACAAGVALIGSAVLAIAGGMDGPTPPLELVQAHYRDTIRIACEQLRAVVASEIRDGSDHYIRINNGECRSRSTRGAEKSLDLEIEEIGCRPVSQESHQYCEYKAKLDCEIIGEARGLLLYRPRNQDACKPYQKLVVTGMVRARERDGRWDFAYFKVLRAD